MHGRPPGRGQSRKSQAGRGQRWSGPPARQKALSRAVPGRRTSPSWKLAGEPANRIWPELEGGKECAPWAPGFPAQACPNFEPCSRSSVDRCTVEISVEYGGRRVIERVRQGQRRLDPLEPMIG